MGMPLVGRGPLNLLSFHFFNILIFFFIFFSRFGEEFFKVSIISLICRGRRSGFPRKLPVGKTLFNIVARPAFGGAPKKAPFIFLAHGLNMRGWGEILMNMAVLTIPVDEPVVLSLRIIPIKGIFNGPVITAGKNRPQNTSKQNPAKKCFRFSNVDGTHLPFTNDLPNLSG